MVAPCWGFCLPEPIGPGPPEPPLFFLPYQEPSTTVGTASGEVGQLLRREGLYSSHLTTWRKAAHSGSLKALSKKRGRKPERNPLDEKVRKLERRNARLENELRKAHLIIDVQGKVAGLLGISLDDGTNS